MDSPPHTVTGWPGQGRPAHADRPTGSPRRLASLIAGGVLLTALGLGARACLAPAGPSRSTPSGASQITVTPVMNPDAPEASPTTSPATSPATSPGP